MKKFSIVILLFLCFCVCVNAETKTDYKTMRHELRVGWGDQMFESLVWHNPTAITTSMPEPYRQIYKEDYHYDQHIWLEYQYRFAYWFSLGSMVDLSEVHWSEVTRNGMGAVITKDPGHFFCNVVIMPTVRFTYFHHPNVNIYSGLGFGIGINSGTEKDFHDRLTDVGAALNLSVIGVSANYKRWFWTVDFGGLYSLKNFSTIFLASSRMINVGLGVRF